MKLSIAFLQALLAYLFSSALFPSFKWLSFSPFLALLYQKSSLSKSLWLSLLCGLITDLFTFQSFFGCEALCYTLLTFFLHRQKKHFYIDNSFSLILYTTLISMAISAAQLFLLCPYDRGEGIGYRLICCDLILMPIFDACYTFVWLICPQKIYHSIKLIDWKRISSYR